MRLKGKKPIFDQKDTFSLDQTLNPIIAAGLKRFLDEIKDHDGHDDDEGNSFGIPAKFVEPNPQENNYEVTLGKGRDEWFSVLEKMIYAFDSIEPDLPNDTLEMVGEQNPNEQGYYPMTINVLDQNAYDIHRKEIFEHEQKVAEGLSLFAKHYNDLWW